MKPWYRSWFDSPYYHMLYADRDEREAAAFIERLIDRLAPAKEARMLDVACGKGRHARQLASRGFDVTGIDLSENSICEAEKHSAENLHFFVHDMRRLFWIRYFDYAFNFFTSFGYFDTLREHHNSLRMISRALKPGGIFVLDYLNACCAEKELIPFSEKKAGSVLFEVRKKSGEQHIDKEITVRDPEFGEEHIFHEKVAKFSCSTLISMLESHGLRTKEVFGDYELSPFNEEHSPRIILVAEKK